MGLREPPSTQFRGAQPQATPACDVSSDCSVSGAIFKQGHGSAVAIARWSLRPQSGRVEHCEPLLQVMANLRQQLARAKRLRHIIIAAGGSRLLSFTAERIRRDCDDRD